nr:hypothetical protein CFP56_73493 [Quercus suber]
MSTHNWILPRFPDNYSRERDSDEREYNVGLQQEWEFRVNESNALHDDLVQLGAPLVDRISLTLPQRNMHQYECAVAKIKKESFEFGSSCGSMKQSGIQFRRKATHFECEEK